MEALILLGSVTIVTISFLTLACFATAYNRRNFSLTHGRELNAANVIELHYDIWIWGTRLRQIGDLEIGYDSLGTRPKWLGAVELHYDSLGTRLRQIGAMELHYDIWGTRLRQIGDLKISYDSWGTSPKCVVLKHYPNLNKDDLITLFFVLYEITRKKRKKNISNNWVVQ